MMPIHNRYLQVAGLFWLVTWLSSACGPFSQEGKRKPGENDQSSPTVGPCTGNDPEKDNSNNCPGRTIGLNSGTITVLGNPRLETVAGSAVVVNLKFTPTEKQWFGDLAAAPKQRNSGIPVTFTKIYQNSTTLCLFVPNDTLPGEYGINLIPLGTDTGEVRMFEKGAELTVKVSGQSPILHQMNTLCPSAKLQPHHEQLKAILDSSNSID